MLYQERKEDYLISTDKKLLNIETIHQYLSQESYWAKGIPVEIVQRSIDHSFCFGIYYKGEQVGFARLVTDYAVFAYLADVFVLPEHRGNGLSKWLMQFIVNNKEVQGLRRWMLATRDAHTLYTQVGFTGVDMPERLMQKLDPDVYKKKE